MAIGPRERDLALIDVPPEDLKTPDSFPSGPPLSIAVRIGETKRLGHGFIGARAWKRVGVRVGLWHAGAARVIQLPFEGEMERRLHALTARYNTGYMHWMPRRVYLEEKF